MLYGTDGMEADRAAGTAGRLRQTGWQTGKKDSYLAIGADRTMDDPGYQAHDTAFLYDYGGSCGSDRDLLVYDGGRDSDQRSGAADSSLFSEH